MADDASSYGLTEGWMPPVKKMDDPVGERLPIMLMVRCPGDNALANVEGVCFLCAHYRGMKSMRMIICSCGVEVKK